MDTTLPIRSVRERVASAAEPCCGGELTTSLDSARTTLLADWLKALADPTRLRMLDLLVEQPEPLCVCEITDQFDLRQPTISHHLRILREAGLITSDKRGVWSYYAATEKGKRSLSTIRTLT